jgi:hypothetical protein
MKASSAGKHEYGGKGGCRVMDAFGPLDFNILRPVPGGCFESYEPFVPLIFQFFFRAAVN